MRDEEPKPDDEPKPTGESRTPVLIPQPGGRGALLSGGMPGNKGGPGRPRNELKEALAEIRRDPEAQKALAEAAKDPESKGFPVAWRLAERYDPDRPSERLDVTGNLWEDLVRQGGDPPAEPQPPPSD